MNASLTTPGALYLMGSDNVGRDILSRVLFCYRVSLTLVASVLGVALLHRPKLLNADEPGTALDVTTQDEILRLLEDLVAAERLTLLLVTHNLAVVRQTAAARPPRAGADRQRRSTGRPALSRRGAGDRGLTASCVSIPKS